MSKHIISFASDNYAGVHPTVLDAMRACNAGHAPAYGADEYTERAIAELKQHFGPHCEVLFVMTGTGANMLALQSITESFQSILCAESAHINNDECGAIEKTLGARIIPIKTTDGKLTPALCRPHLRGFGDQHRAQPRVISISQATEYGTLYQPQELRALAELASSHNMFLHVDGSRLANAASTLNTDLASLTTDVGVDVVSFGGTKNGLMFGEAVIFLRPELAKNAKFFRKQLGQLVSKHRFVAAQFSALMNDDLFLKNAEQANRMAQRLAIGLKNIKGVTITQAVECNVVFAQLPKASIAPLQQQFAFYVWDEAKSEVRWMTAFDTTPEHVDQFLAAIKATLEA